MGFSRVDDEVDHVLFVNPDVILDGAFIETAESFMEGDPVIGILSGRIEGYDFALQQKTDRFDSTGIFRKWYGRWYDRGQGEKISGQYGIAEDVPAACGAVLFCRKKSLEQSSLATHVIFDPDFFLYKEDIELCLRVRERGWRIRYVPDLLAFHGRGWQKKRSKMHRDVRLTAARSEMLLYRKHPSPYMVWALLKYFSVAVFNL